MKWNWREKNDQLPIIADIASFFNKAVYTATCVAGGWAGAEMPICTLKAKYHRQTDRPTNKNAFLHV